MPPERAGSENHTPKALTRQSSQSISTPQLVSKIPQILPHERVFPIQIGSELFKLSGASLSSDGELPCLDPEEREMPQRSLIAQQAVEVSLSSSWSKHD